METVPRELNLVKNVADLVSILTYRFTIGVWGLKVGSLVQYVTCMYIVMYCTYNNNNAKFDFKVSFLRFTSGKRKRTRKSGTVVNCPQISSIGILHPENRFGFLFPQILEFNSNGVLGSFHDELLLCS